jgi:GNAT superfamily N-acetyltransferase
MRGTGIGSGLLTRLEAEARDRGCIGAWVDTFSFQARPFYEKHGYALFGSIEDQPPGHARHFLFKRFNQG